MLLQYRRSSAVKPGRWVLVFGSTRNPYRAGAATRLEKISQKRFYTPPREEDEGLEPVHVRRRRRLLRGLALLGLHALPVLLGGGGGDVGLDVDDR